MRVVGVGVTYCPDGNGTMCDPITNMENKELNPIYRAWTNWIPPWFIPYMKLTLADIKIYEIETCCPVSG